MAKLPTLPPLPAKPTKKLTVRSAYAQAPSFARKPNLENTVKQSKGLRQYDEAKHCGAQLRNKERGRRCTQIKGSRTPHLGEGKCWLHGGLTPIKHGLGSLIKHGRLKDLMVKMKHIDHDLLDLTPEIELLRAVTYDFVNRYDTFTDQLESWYDTLDLARKEADVPLPPIPRKFPNIEDVAPLLESISRMVERIHKITREGSITLDVFRALMTQMGLIVAGHISDPATLQKIEEGWSGIMVNPRSYIKDSGAQQPEEEEE